MEGHEAAVLDGAAGLLRRHRPVLILEANDPAALTERIAPLGYRWVDYDPVSRRAVAGGAAGRRDQRDRGGRLRRPRRTAPPGLMRRNRALGVVDQAIASLSNVAMVVIAARALSPGDFGGFAVAMAVYAFVLGVARALVDGAPPGRRLRRPSDSRGAGAGGGHDGAGRARRLCSAPSAALVVGGAAGPVAAGPGARSCLSSFCRTPGATWPSPPAGRRAPSSSTVCGSPAQAAASVWLILGDAVDPAVFVAAWGAAGSVAALTGMARAGVRPSLRRGHQWISRAPPPRRAVHGRVPGGRRRRQRRSVVPRGARRAERGRRVPGRPTPSSGRSTSSTWASC